MLRRKKIKRKNKVYNFIIKFLTILLFLVLFFYFLIFWSVKLTYLFLSKINYFCLSKAYVKNHFVLENEDAFEFIGLKPGVNIFSIELSSLAKKLKERHPEFEDIIVRRIPPDTIMVFLKERSPIMQIKLAKFYPVDKSGFVIPYPKDSPYIGLPIIIGVEPGEIGINKISNSLRIKKAIEIINLLNEGDFSWRKRVAKINLTSLNDISIFFDNDMEVKLGAYIEKEKFEKLSKILDEIKIRSLSPSFIDLRFKDIIIGPK